MVLVAEPRQPIDQFTNRSAPTNGLDLNGAGFADADAAAAIDTAGKVDLVWRALGVFDASNRTALDAIATFCAFSIRDHRSRPQHSIVHDLERRSYAEALTADPAG